MKLTICDRSINVNLLITSQQCVIGPYLNGENVHYDQSSLHTSTKINSKFEIQNTKTQTTLTQLFK